MPHLPETEFGPVTVRAFRRDEADLLERFSPKTPGTHRARLARQERGEGVYLGAWLSERPAGHVWLEWVPEADGTAPRPVDCPRLVDLFVVTDLRSRGIGTRLMEAAEGRAGERGHGCAGLDVGVDNPRAHALYLRRGYVDAGLGRYRIGWPVEVGAGRRWFETEECVYLVRRLSGGGA